MIPYKKPLNMRPIIDQRNWIIQLADDILYNPKSYLNLLLSHLLMINIGPSGLHKAKIVAHVWLSLEGDPLHKYFFNQRP